MRTEKSMLESDKACDAAVRAVKVVVGKGKSC